MAYAVSIPPPTAPPPHTHTETRNSRGTGGPTFDADVTGGDRLAHQVGRLAHVGTGVLRVGVQQVQRHVAEVVGRLEPVT